MTVWNNRAGRTTPVRNLLVLCAVLIALFCLSATQLFAQAPNYSNSTISGTTIPNKATVSYTDSNGTAYSKDSGSVNIYVQQVDAYYITPGTVTITGVANQVVNQQFTITNNSNGDDTVALAIANITGTQLTGAQLYYANAGGTAPDLTKPVTGPITMTYKGGFTFFVQGTMPSTYTATPGTFDVTVTDQGNAALDSSKFGVTLYDNTNAPTGAANRKSTVTVQMVQGANVAVSKFFNTSSGGTLTPVTNGLGGSLVVTLRVSNQGTADSGLVNINDALNGTGFTYDSSVAAKFDNVAFSGGSATDGAGITATMAYDSSANKLAFTLSKVTHSSTQYYDITFGVTASVVPATYTNTAYFNYVNGGTTIPSGSTGNTCVNGAADACASASGTYTTNANYAFTLAITTGKSATASGTYAQPIYFYETVHNGGNSSDSYTVSNNLGTGGTSFPAGTKFFYYVSNAGVPGGAMNPAAGNSATVGDPGALYTTGPVTKGTDFNYIIAVQLPTGTYCTSCTFTSTESASGLSGIVPAQVTATQTDTFSVVAALMPLDLRTGLTNDPAASTPVNPASAGAGPGPGSPDVTSPAVTPGSSYTFALTVTNNQATSDTFKVVASTSTSFGASDVVPAGWTISYFIPAAGANCSTVAGSSPVSGSGVAVASTSTSLVCAVLTVPVNQAQAPVSIFFKAATTGSSGLYDEVDDVVTIGATHVLTITTASQSVQAGAGGTMISVITNTGNNTETVNFPAGFTAGNTANPVAGSFGVTVAFDAAGTQPVSGTTSKVLAPGATLSIYVIVTTSSGDLPTWYNDTALTVTAVSGATASATDRTTIISSSQNITVLKEQAYDPLCDGMGPKSGGVEQALSFSSITAVQAKPTECVAYRITATNNTGLAINAVQISDSLNSTWVTFCGLFGGSSACAKASGATGSGITLAQWTTVGGAASQDSSAAFTGGTVTSNKLTGLPDGGAAVFIFEVKVN